MVLYFVTCWCFDNLVLTVDQFVYVKTTHLRIVPLAKCDKLMPAICTGVLFRPRPAEKWD